MHFTTAGSGRGGKVNAGIEVSAVEVGHVPLSQQAGESWEHPFSLQVHGPSVGRGASVGLAVVVGMVDGQGTVTVVVPKKTSVHSSE